MVRMALYLLDSPRLERDGKPVRIQRRKVMALLVYLAVTEKSHPRDALATMFWPEHDQNKARAALRRTLSELQKILGEAVLSVEQGSIGLRTSTGFWTDIHEFHNKVRAYQEHGHHPDDPCPECLEALAEAVSLYRDDFLVGFTLDDSLEFDEWQILQAEVIHRELIGALSRLVLGHTAGGEIGMAIHAARRWVELDPVDETAYRHLMQLFTWNGQRSEALRLYHDCVRLLDRELNVLPMEETTRLYEHIRAQKIFLPSQGLKIPRPIMPVKLPEPRRKPNNLPIQLTSFVGRVEELSVLSEELARPEVHLLTLTGPAGVGKTRLSLELAAILLDQFDDGAFFVPLASIRESALIGPTIIHALGIRELLGKSAVDTLKEYLRNRQMLLVLDNFEHLTKAAPMITDLLAATPRMKVLVTSRILLHVYGEHLHPILPMKLPTSGKVIQLENPVLPEAVQLFVERARAVKPDFALTQENLLTVVEICKRLDGLPLAIELAAARIRQMSPQAMLAQWVEEGGRSPLQTLTSGPRDIPARHKTLRNAITWSYNLLQAREQAFFRQAGVFMGGWTLEAAENIIRLSLPDGAYSTSASFPNAPTTGDYDPLVDGSLVQRLDVSGETRFVMLETIREFAQEQLVECGEMNALRRRHVEYFLAFAEKAKAEMAGSQQVVWMSRLERDYENLRAALKWSIECQEAEIALRLGSALGKFWYAGDPIYWDEGRMWLEGALNLRPPESMSLAIRANALNEAGVLAWAQIDYDRATSLFTENLKLRKRVGDKAGIASALGNLGLVARERLNLASARAYQEECLVIRRELGNKQGIATVLSNLGLVVADQGDCDYAISLYEESIKINRELQNITGLALTMHNLGGLLIENCGDLSMASDLLTESLKLSRELGPNFFLIPHTLNHLGTLYSRRGEFIQAQGFLEESLNLARASNNQYAIGHAYHGLGRLAHLRSLYEEALAYYQQSLLVLHEIKGYVVMIWGLISLADLACIYGDMIRAATLVGAVEKLLAVASAALPISRREEFERVSADTRASLGEAAFIEARAQGQEMAVDQIIAFVLGDRKQHRQIHG